MTSCCVLPGSYLKEQEANEMAVAAAREELEAAQAATAARAAQAGAYTRPLLSPT
jgi:hypothetical protein